MKTLADFAENVDPALLVTGVLALLLLIFGFFVLLNKFILDGKDRKLQKHPRLLDISYSGSYLKVLGLNIEKSIIHLGINPDREYPFGRDHAWFELNHLIPESLCKENFVIKVIGRPDNQIECSAGPIF